MSSEHLASSGAQNALMTSKYFLSVCVCVCVCVCASLRYDSEGGFADLMKCVHNTHMYILMMMNNVLVHVPLV